MFFKIISLFYTYKNIFLIVASLSCITAFIAKYTNVIYTKVDRSRRASAVEKAIDTHALETKYLQETGELISLEERAKSIEKLLQELEQEIHKK